MCCKFSFKKNLKEGKICFLQNEKKLKIKCRFDQTDFNFNKKILL